MRPGNLLVRERARAREANFNLAALAKDVSPLRVSEDDPLDLHILQHHGAILSGEGTRGLHVAVLSGHANILLGQAAHETQVHRRRSNHNLCQTAKQINKEKKKREKEKRKRKRKRKRQKESVAAIKEPFRPASSPVAACA